MFGIIITHCEAGEEDCTATVLAPSEVPASLSHLLTKTKSPSVFVRRYGFGQEDCRLVPVSRLEALAGNRVDRERAGKTEEIKANYDMALAELRGDV